VLTYLVLGAGAAVAAAAYGGYVYNLLNSLWIDLEAAQASLSSAIQAKTNVYRDLLAVFHELYRRNDERQDVRNQLTAMAEGPLSAENGAGGLLGLVTHLGDQAVELLTRMIEQRSPSRREWAADLRRLATHLSDEIVQRRDAVIEAWRTYRRVRLRWPVCLLGWLLGFRKLPPADRPRGPGPNEAEQPFGWPEHGTGGGREPGRDGDGRGADPPADASRDDGD